MKFDRFTEIEQEMLAKGSEYPVVQALLRAVEQERERIAAERMAHMRINTEDVTEDLRFKLGQEAGLAWVAEVENKAKAFLAKQNRT